MSDTRQDIEAALLRLTRDDGVAPNTHDLACALRALLRAELERRAPVEAQPQGDAARLTPAQQRAAYLEGLGAYGVKGRPSDAHDQPSPRPGGEAVSPVAQAWARCDLRAPTLAAALADRARLGEARYGQPLQAHNGRDALRDAGEEVVDGVHYLTQAILERGGAEGEVPTRAAVCLSVARARLGEAWVWLERARGESQEPASWGVGYPSPDRLT